MDTHFIFECSTRYFTSERSERLRYRVEHSKIKFVSRSGHVISSPLYSMFLALSLWVECCSVTIQMKAIEQYFPVVLCKVVLTFESVDEFLRCDHSNESY